MFVNQHHLQYLLEPVHYTDPAQLDREIRELMVPSWQLVASQSELPRPGDYATLNLLGHSLLIRNCEGTIRAFQNVCAHRHCQLASEPYGHSPVLQCQYHGWEYDSSGKTKKIPDARCFRPWDRDHSQLVTYRTETCGDLVFVALTDSPPSLREWLAPNFDDLERDFSPPEWRRCWNWDYEAPCNWKIPLENTVESYHVAMLHKKFYGSFYPSEEKSLHVLTDRYTELTYLSDTRMEAWQARLRKYLGGTPTNQYVHRHYFPNTVLVTTDSFNYGLTLIPLAPDRVRIVLRAYTLHGKTWNPITRLVTLYAGWAGKKYTLQVHNEDRAVYPAQQKGIEASRQKGVLGTREERIYAFQEYILKSLGLPLPVNHGCRQSDFHGTSV